MKVMYYNRQQAVTGRAYAGLIFMGQKARRRPEAFGEIHVSTVRREGAVQ
jgi:hypothetical protein